MQMLEPDLAIPFPDTNAELKDFHEKVAAACKTAAYLGVSMIPGDDDMELAEELFLQSLDPAVDQKPAIKQSYTPATYGLVRNLLNEYSVRTVDNAMQIRQLVTNKLILESDNADPKVRIRALELLGKITDVGLFTEKSEVTVTHRSSEDLVASLRAKIKHLKEPKDITPPKPVLEGEIL
jgi:hypothetical protein